MDDQFGNYTYTATVDTPSQGPFLLFYFLYLLLLIFIFFILFYFFLGWRGFLIQFEYNYGDVGLYTFKQSTQAYVVPNTLPFPPCGNNCQPGVIPKYPHKTTIN